MTDPAPSSQTSSQVSSPSSRPRILIAAFEGWNDAGDAASGVIDHLVEVWAASRVAEFNSEDYYDYQVNRPSVDVDERGVRTITWPSTYAALATPDGFDHEVVLIRGIEPSMRWKAFSDELVTLGKDMRVDLAITLGALLADAPHTRPVPVTGNSANDALGERLGYSPSRYRGPTGIVGVLQQAFTLAGIPAVSLWAAVPHYVAAPPCPKATLALIGRIEDVVEMSIPTGDLPEDARAWQRGVDELAAEDGEIAEYVRSLEEARDTSDLPEASGEEIAREFERYLRRRGTGGAEQN